jgi:aconitate hydratase
MSRFGVLNPGIKPFSPDHVVPLKELVGLKLIKFAQAVAQFSQDLEISPEILRGKTIPSFESIDQSRFPSGGPTTGQERRSDFLIASGARCPGRPICIGMGGVPPEGRISFRSYNRNFKGRSGTLSARVYLANPLVAALVAIKGEVVDPLAYKFSLPATFAGPDERQPDPFIQPPPKNPDSIKVVRGPDINQFRYDAFKELPRPRS